MDKKYWFLEGYAGGSKSIRRYPLYEFPFLAGRQEGLQLSLDTAGASRLHAEFALNGERLILRDLNSTNGTFVNRQRCQGEREVHDGDILHFADQEFRLRSQAAVAPGGSNETRIGIGTLSEQLPQGVRAFQQLLATEAVSAVFQPIVDAQGQPIAYEMLGRGAFEGLPSAPWPLFKIAESLDLEVPFSELLRRCAMETAMRLDPGACYFFNIHPREAERPDQLLRRMDEIRQTQPSLRLVLEVHEAAVTDGRLIRRIRDHLRDLDIGLAYDDFGAGQARLIELTEVPPDYVKFDMALIRKIDQATEAKRTMLAMFQQFLRGMGIATLAEGVETAEEFQILRDIGIDYYQGYYLGKPNETLDILR